MTSTMLSQITQQPLLTHSTFIHMAFTTSKILREALVATEIYMEERRKGKREGHLHLLEKGCVRGGCPNLLHSCGDLDGTLALSAMVVTELAKFLHCL